MIAVELSGDVEVLELPHRQDDRLMAGRRSLVIGLHKQSGRVQAATVCAVSFVEDALLDAHRQP
jgi:hypothetical protein